MAGTIFQVKTYGDTIVSRKLYKMAERAGDMRPAWPAVTRIAMRGINNSFVREGPGWPPLKPSTQRRRIAEGFPGQGPIGVRTGAMKRKLTVNPEVTAGTSSLVISAGDIEYAQYFLAKRPITITRYFQTLMSQAVREALTEAYRNG